MQGVANWMPMALKEHQSMVMLNNILLKGKATKKLIDQMFE